MKFTVYDYQGQPHSYYKVEQESIAPAKIIEGSGHMIVLLDCSGSMKDQLKKVVNNISESLQNHHHGNILISLVSYSSIGNSQIELNRVAIKDFTNPNSEASKTLASLNTKSGTSISDGLSTALSLVKSGETTIITLHSDGQSNDSSSISENQKIQAIIENQKNPFLTVNTIAHTPWADFQTLSKIANKMGGRCIFARSSDDLPMPLNQTLDDISGNVEESQSIKVGSANFVVFISKKQQRFQASCNDFMVSGLLDSSDKQVLRFTQIDQKSFDALNENVAEGLELYAFTKAMLTLNNLTLAKFGLNTTKDQQLISVHRNAINNEQIALFSMDLNHIIFEEDANSRLKLDGYVQHNDELSILDISNLLTAHAKNIFVHHQHLIENYVHRTMERIPGTRNPSGRLIPPDFHTEMIEGQEFVPLENCTINQNSANINLLIKKNVKLINSATSKQVSTIQGIDVRDLVEFRNYTIVKDGVLNIDAIQIQIKDEQTFNIFQNHGIVQGLFDSSSTYEVKFQDRPLLPASFNMATIDGVFDKVMGYRTLHLAITSMLKAKSSDYSTKQVTELQKHCLSPRLNFNPPTTTPYPDLEQAMANGEVERRRKLIIDIGTTQVQNKPDFISANACLQKYYEYSKNTSSKISWENVLESKDQIKHKALSKKVKVTTADEFMITIFDALLGLGDYQIIEDMFTELQSPQIATDLKPISKGKYPTDIISVLEQAQKVLALAIDDIYTAVVSPLVFFIGTSGMLPTELEKATYYTGEQLHQKYPHLKLQAEEMDGDFYVLRNNIISIFTRDELVNR